MMGDKVCLTVPLHLQGVTWASQVLSQLILEKSFVYGPEFVHEAIVMLKQES